MSQDTSSRDPARPPRVVSLGKYQVNALIARGGMGEVYRGRDTETDREVAIKVLNRKMAERPDAVERFQREARNAAKLRHENIVAVHDIGDFKGTIFLVMEFVEGIDLADHIARNGPLDPQEARLITFQAARALLHAHKRGIVHRDIKPSNFLLTRPQGRLVVKLTDLGLSRQEHEDEYRLTREGNTVGTIDYIAPEQARDSGSADIRSDIYSLGCTLYHMLTGQPPFPDGGLAERIYKHMEVEPRDVRELRPRIPADLAKIVQRMLAKKPEDRYQTPRELLHALTLGSKSSAREPEPSQPSPEPSGEPAGPRLRKTESTQAGERETPSETRKPREKPESGPARKRSDRPRPRAKTENSPRKLWMVGAASGAAAVLVLLVLLIANRRGSGTPDDPLPDPVPPLAQTTQPGPVLPPLVSRTTEPIRPDPEKKLWPALRAGQAAIDREDLARRIPNLTAHLAPPAQTPVLRVSRLSRTDGEYASLSDAVRAVQARGGVGLPGAGQRIEAIIELHDNGPFYDPGVSLSGKSIVVRAAPGFRPLLCWDLQRAEDKSASSLFHVQNGNLVLEGIEVVLPAPPATAGKLSFVHAVQGDVLLSNCSFSAGGTHPPGVVLVKLEGERKGGDPVKCRLSRCQARGNSLAGLDCEEGSRAILLDDTLLTVGEAPLLQLRIKPGNRQELYLVRSTLTGRGAGVRLTGEDTILAPDSFRGLAWDTILSHTGSSRAGVLLELPAKMKSEASRWQGVNCLYAGWRHLLRGPREIDGTDVDSWDRLWSAFGVERAEAEPWPAASFSELAEVPAAEYRTDRAPGLPVGFASTSWPVLRGAEGSTPAPATLGCPVALLPLAHDRWLQWTISRFRTPPVELRMSSSAPEIPAPGDGLYHGERLDLSQVNLGAHLDRIQKNQRLGSRVVLQLFCPADRQALPSGPIRLKGSDLVLHFEPGRPAQKDAPPVRLILPGSGRARGGGLIEVEEGSLEIIGGEVQLAESSAAGWFVKVQGGSVRMHDCHLRGPQGNPPGEFEGLVLLEPGKDPRSRSLAIHQSVLDSGGVAVRAAGAGVRLRLGQSLVVAGADVLELEPQSKGNAELEQSVILDSCTIAARRAVVRVGAVPAVLAGDPIVIQSRACAFLHPFEGKGGLLLTEAESLQKGAVLWQSENDLFDKRWHFAAATPDSIPGKPDPFRAWTGLWGRGARGGQGDFPHATRFEGERWPLDRLVLTAVGNGTFDTRGIGADLLRLGLRKSKPR